MKLIFIKKELIKYLYLINIISDNKQNYTIFKLINNILYILHNNLINEIIIKINLKCENNISGIVTLSIKKFYSICNLFKENNIINCSMKTNIFQINYNKSIFNLNIINNNIINYIPNIYKKYNFYIKKEILIKALKAIEFSIANQDIRSYLNGINLEINNNFIKFLTCDGYRISSYTYEYNISYNINIIIPKKGLLELIKYIPYNEDINIYFYYFNNKLQIKINNVYYITKLISNKYPDLDYLIKQDFKYKIFINNINILKKMFINIKFLINHKNPGIKFEANNNKLIITYINNENDSFKEKINIIYNDYKIKFILNFYYLLDILNIIDMNLILEINYNLNCVKLTQKYNNNLLYIIMPIKD